MNKFFKNLIPKHPFKNKSQNNSKASSSIKESKIISSAEVEVNKRCAGKLFNPVTIFTNNLLAARFWMILSFFLIGSNIISPILITYFQTKNRENVVILDPSGSFYLSPIMGIKKAQKLQDNIAELATMAMLSRNPNGLDNKELLVQTLTKSAVKRVETSMKKNDTLFADKLMHQKVEITKINTLKTSDNKVYSRVTGQLIITGFYKGQTFQEGMKFTLNLLLVRNPKFGSSLRLPLAVSKYNLQTSPLNNLG